MITEFVITRGEQRKRLDIFLVHREPEVSRSRLQRLIQLGRIRVNNLMVKPSFQVKPGDRITLDTPKPGSVLVKGEVTQLDILHEDEAMLVINKPPGVVMHPTAGMWSGTILNGVLDYFQVTTQKGCSPGIVHRLDQDTSGVVVVAKNLDAHRSLAKQFAQHSITRQYQALVWNVPTSNDGVIHLAIGRDAHDSTRHSPDTTRPRTAITEYHMIKRWANVAAYLNLVPRTGRTHQLRVHLASHGLPILGDRWYGKGTTGEIADRAIPRMMLHARSLGFQHPNSGDYHEYTIECPPDMQALTQHLQQTLR
ncbi:MAG: RluA family pseudouridine synthase [Nitrospirales bacterium]|nr:RluA family pseudouridine synthase [Nitrospira sp.]MDR4502455.1 RluA family pseudouridine synthase [Nitrospirales bacterium]